MRILDENGIEIINPDLSFGYLKEERLFVKHHDVIEAVEEVGHYEVIAEYPNGGKDVEWIVDVAGVEAKEAWDEYEEILRYIAYTEDELAAIEEERNKPTTEERIAELEAQNEMLLQCILEMSEMVYA